MEAFAGHGEGDGAQVLADGIDVGRVAQAHLDVERGGDADHLGDLVSADVAAEVVRHLHVDVQWGRDGRAQFGELGEGEVGRDVDRAGAERFEHAGGGGIRDAEQDGDL